jgi:hypothetical protein
MRVRVLFLTKCTDTFAGFVSPSHTDAVSRDTTPSPKVYISISLNSTDQSQGNIVALVADSVSLFVPGL